MSDTLVTLNRKITGAKKLKSVVHTMKVLAASNIGQYEAAVRSLDGYFRNIEHGFYVCLHELSAALKHQGKTHKAGQPLCAIIFGSDQGLVGRFNDIAAECAASFLKTFPCEKLVWSVGERVSSRLEDSEIPMAGIFDVPSSINAVSNLGAQILLETDKYRSKNPDTELYVFYNKFKGGTSYEPVHQKILPLDKKWLLEISGLKWPTKNLPEAIHGKQNTMPALISEYLFASLFRAAAESLMSENAARLAAMQRAEKNIDELLDNKTLSFHRMRQDSIDEELFDVISGSDTPEQSKGGAVPPKTANL